MHYIFVSGARGEVHDRTNIRTSLFTSKVGRSPMRDIGIVDPGNMEVGYTIK